MSSSASAIISPSSDAIPIPLDTSVPSSSTQSRGLKRGLDDHNAYFEERLPAKAPRGHNQDSVSRTSSNPTIVGETQRVNRPSSPSIRATSEVVQVNGAESTKPICRDYHCKNIPMPNVSFLFDFLLDKGYCSRGALCNYSHGADAVVPPPGMWLPDGTGFNPMMSFMPMMMPFGSIPLSYDGGAYDPNQSRMDLNNSGAVAPRQASKTPVPDTPPPIAIQNGLGNSGVGDEGSQVSARGGHRLNHPGVRGRGRGRQVSSNRPSSNERTLVVEKIPPENLTVDSVNQWFTKFGSVTNVAIDKRGSKALVSFNNHSEAEVAWKSQDAVFGNRFVKVYWHRPVEGQGVVGKLALEASSSRFQKVENNSARFEDQEVATEKNVPSRNVSTLGIEARKALEKNMAEQKVLFSRLKTAEEDKKPAILTRIRVLSDGMNDPLSVPPSNLLLDEIKPPPSTPLPRSNSEQLDKELDLRQAVQDLTRRAQDPKEDHDAIRVELEKLKAKARVELFVAQLRLNVFPNRLFPKVLMLEKVRLRLRVGQSATLQFTTLDDHIADILEGVSGDERCIEVEEVVSSWTTVQSSSL
jgi:RNA-binding protein 26